MGSTRTIEVSRRTEKIASQLRGELARLLLEEVSDPRVRMVTLTRVDVAPDLSNARVHYSVLEVAEDAAVEEIDAGLQSAAAFLRRRAAKNLQLRRMPELRFRYDPSLALGTRTLATIRELDRSGPRDSRAGEGLEAVRGGSENGEEA